MNDTNVAAPVELTAAEIDAVAGGALLNVVAVDVVDVNNNDVDVAVAIPVNAAAAISVLGGDPTAFATQQPGRIRQ